MHFVARKRFGQNFLRDANVIDRIISCLEPDPSEPIVEIGPGKGALTTHILSLVKRLTVVELDRDLLPYLEEVCSGSGELIVHNADALFFDFCGLADAGKKLRIVGNLPYNISTPLIFHLLEQVSCIKDMHFMLQKEVVQRLAAEVGSKAYGRLSVMVQYFCKVERLFTIGPEAFSPMPKVHSSFVKLVPYVEKPVEARDIKKLSLVVKRAFTHRRKTIHNCLRNLLTSEQLLELNIDPKLRPENLSIKNFVDISNIL